MSLSIGVKPGLHYSRINNIMYSVKRVRGVFFILRCCLYYSCNIASSCQVSSVYRHWRMIDDRCTEKACWRVVTGNVIRPTAMITCVLRLYPVTLTGSCWNTLQTEAIECSLAVSELWAIAELTEQTHSHLGIGKRKKTEWTKGREGYGKSLVRMQPLAWKKEQFLCNHISHVPVTLTLSAWNGCALTWRSLFASLVAIEPFVS